jgi:hypothetical protein
LSAVEGRSMRPTFVHVLTGLLLGTALAGLLNVPGRIVAHQESIPPVRSPHVVKPKRDLVVRVAPQVERTVVTRKAAAPKPRVVVRNVVVRTPAPRTNPVAPPAVTPKRVVDPKPAAEPKPAPQPPQPAQSPPPTAPAPAPPPPPAPRTVAGEPSEDDDDHRKKAKKPKKPKKAKKPKKPKKPPKAGNHEQPMEHEAGDDKREKKDKKQKHDANDHGEDDDDE